MWNSLRAKATIIVLPVLLIFASALLMSGCRGSPSSGGETSSASSNSSLSKVALEVPTIWCSDCKLRVEKSIRSVPGVKEVKFDDQRIEVVVITYDTAQTTSQTIVKAIERGGDKVTQTTKP